jgi:hypothetical protein
MCFIKIVDLNDIHVDLDEQSRTCEIVEGHPSSMSKRIMPFPHLELGITYHGTL